MSTAVATACVSWCAVSHDADDELPVCAGEEVRKVVPGTGSVLAVGSLLTYVPGDGLRVVAFTDDQHHRSELDDMTAGQARALAAVLMSAADRLDRLASSQHPHNPGRTTR